MGVTAGLNALGVAYFNGLGVQKDVPRAIEYLRRAVQGGDTDGMTNLAAALLGGVEGVQRGGGYGAQMISGIGAVAYARDVRAAAAAAAAAVAGGPAAC